MKKIILLTLIFVLVLSSVSFAGTAKVVTKVEKALKTVSDWILKISSPAAAVAIGTGFLMKKFSFGDEERMAAGKKLIRSALFSYAFVLLTNLILEAVKSILG